jgi:hypothetical protein
MTLRRPQDPGRPWPWVASFALATVVGHHVGTIFKPLGEIGDTRVADWIDLLTPYAVLGCVAAALLAAAADRLAWLVFAFGAVTYTEGHGIHLSANSIGNAIDYQRIGYLWDETASHNIWYLGWVVIVVALARVLAARAAPTGPAPYLLAVLYGLTWFTNGVEGGTAIQGLVAAAGFSWWGWRERAGAGRLLLLAYGLGFVLIAGFGIWQGGFPQFTDLGWI